VKLVAISTIVRPRDFDGRRRNPEAGTARWQWQFVTKERRAVCRGDQPAIKDTVEVTLPRLNQLEYRFLQILDDAKSSTRGDEHIRNVRRSDALSWFAGHVPDLTRPDSMILGEVLSVVGQQAQTGA
jgi:hypothetical protein